MLKQRKLAFWLVGFLGSTVVMASGAETSVPVLDSIPPISVQQNAVENSDDGNITTAMEAETSAAEKLLNSLSALQNLNANFVQTVRDANGVVVEESEGRFLWKRPDLFRWDVTEPFEQSIVVKDGEQHQYDADLEQLTIQPVSDETLTLPNILLAGNVAELESRFKVRQIAAVAGGSGDSAGTQSLFLLSPVDGGNELQSLLLVFEAGQLVSIEVTDSLEQTNRFELINQPGDGLGEKDFVIETAVGTDVIRL